MRKFEKIIEIMRKAFRSDARRTHIPIMKKRTEKDSRNETDVRVTCRRLSEFLSVRIGAIQPAREDSRAFGAAIQGIVEECWAEACARIDALPLPAPGRRCIHDVACSVDGKAFGLDVRTKDLDEGRYSDGGVCSVSNLLSYIEAGNALLVAEIAHEADPTDASIRRIVHARVLPLRVLPGIDELRIENLGTGQIRLDGALPDEAACDWSRTEDQLREAVLSAAEKHYVHVARTAMRRAREMKRLRAPAHPNA